MTASLLQDARVLYDRILRLGEYNLPIVDLALCVAAASRLPKGTEPLWSFIVGPSGCGKSEIVLSILGLNDYAYECDAFTEASLVSGYVDEKDPNAEHSLVPKIDRSLLVVEDFANVVSMRQEEAAKLQSMLRTAYKGYATKAYGTGTKRVEGRFNILSGTVESIDRFMSSFQLLGPRFLLIRFHIPRHKRRAFVAHAYDAYTHRTQWRQTLRLFVKERIRPFMAGVSDTLLLPGESEPPFFRDGIITVATLVAAARALPPSLGMKWRLPFPNDVTPDEMGSRIGVQLRTLARVRTLLDGRDVPDATDLSLAARIAWDVLPMYSQRTLRALYKVTTLTPVTPFTNAVILPPNSMRALLDQFCSTGICYTSKKDPKVIRWALTKETREYIASTWGKETWWQSLQ